MYQPRRSSAAPALPGRRGEHRRRSKLVTITAVGMTAALVLGGCSSSKSKTTSTTSASTTNAANSVGGTLTVAMGPPFGLSPAGNTNNVPAYYVMWDYEPLLRWAGDGSMQPALATSWKYTDTANKVFVLQLRKGVKFADGEAFNAAAAAKSINYYKTVPGPTSGNYQYLTASATGPYELTITSSRPNPHIDQLVSNFYTGGDIIAPKGVANPSLLKTQSFGAGEYILDSSQTKADSQYVYTPNPNYWDKSAIHWKKVVMQVVQDENAGLSAVKSGQLDVFTGGSATTAGAAKSSGITVASGLALWTGLLLLDHTGQVVKALGDVRVRQAINLAIDRAAVAKAALGAGAIPITQPALPSWEGYDKSLNNAYPYDPTKAKALLAAAGYAKGFTIPVTTNAGSFLEVEIEAIAGELKKVGITLDYHPATNTPTMVGSLSSGKYAAYNLEQSMTSPFFLYEQDFAKGAGLNGLNQVDPKLTALITAASSSKPADAGPLWVAVNKYLVDTAYTVPVAASFQYYYLKKGISYGTLNPTTSLLDPTQIKPGS